MRRRARVLGMFKVIIRGEFLELLLTNGLEIITILKDRKKAKLYGIQFIIEKKKHYLSYKNQT